MANLLDRIQHLPIISSFRKRFMDQLKSKGSIVVNYKGHGRNDAIEFILDTFKRTDMAMTLGEAYQIIMAVKSVEKINGDIAEVGVYKGGSARLIAQYKGQKTLHLFDTFQGIPKINKIDEGFFKEGEYKGTIDEVKSVLAPYQAIKYYQGFFPNTTVQLQPTKFSFVNFDVDTYQTTKDCIEFFYPLMNKGGVMISHDYLQIPGVRKAFDDFFSDKLEPIIQLSGTQCLIVKI